MRRSFSVPDHDHHSTAGAGFASFGLRFGVHPPLPGIIKESGNIGLFIYGMPNKLLVPTVCITSSTPRSSSLMGGT